MSAERAGAGEFVFMFPSNSSATSTNSTSAASSNTNNTSRSLSPAGPRTGARRLLKQPKMTTFSQSTRHSMVDAVPAPNAATSPPAHGKLSHGRSSSFLGFSFRGRTHSSPQQSATLPAIREQGSSANASTDEFGASRSSFSASRANAAHTNGSNTVSGTANMGAAQQQQQQSQSQSLQPGAGRQLHPEIRSIVQLSTAHAHKVYFSGPLVKHIERHPDGRIVGKEEPWREVWAQLGGTTLSVWDMKEIEEASRRGAEVPPSYLNITDAVSSPIL